MLEKEYLICYVEKYDGQDNYRDCTYVTGCKIDREHLEQIRKGLEEDSVGEVVFTNIVFLGEVEDE